MKGKPTGQNIRIEIINSGFTALEAVDEKENRTEKATVLEIGDEVTLVKKGDTILFKAYNIDELEIDGEKYIIIPEDDLKYVWNTSTPSEK
jgi:co-chaperonin GroES (HSP10)